MITAPNDANFAFGFGGLIMENTYAITSGGAATSDIVGRRLESSSSSSQNSTKLGTAVAFSGDTDVTITNDAGRQTVEILRPWDDNVTDSYDFTPLMTCEETTIDLISADWFDFSWTYHKSRLWDTIESSCCVQPTNAPTTIPTIPPTYHLTTDPTPYPTPEPGFETCLMAGLISNVFVIIQRNIDAKTVKIKINGPNDVAFAFGFGGLVMAQTYAITSGGTDASSDIVARVLGASSCDFSISSPCKLGTAIGFSEDTMVTITDDGNIQTVEIVRPWDDGVTGSFDFTPLMTCEDISLEMISAVWNDFTFDYHTERRSLTVTSGCACLDVTDAPTEVPSVNPTKAPIAALDTSDASKILCSSPYFFGLVCFILHLSTILDLHH